jgi:hypothetical protein
LKVIRERNLPEFEDDLDGIVHLIDDIQDFAVDKLGYNANEVYDFEDEDPDYHPEPLWQPDSNEPDEQKFAREMSDLIYEIHREASYLYDHEDMPEEFVETILNDPANVQACKELIRKDILDDLRLDPDKFHRDETNKLRYDESMFDYGYVIEGYCLEKFYEGKTKEAWLCPHCGSDNIKVKVWAKPNSGMLTDVDDAYPINNECHCLDCEQDGKAIFATTIKYLAEVIGFQVVDDEGNIHPDMAGSFCVYSLSQAQAMIKKGCKNPEQKWKLLAIWRYDIEEPTIMYTEGTRM